MWERPKAIALAVIVTGAALVPLFGDPRSTPVTHPLWARMLLRSLEMPDALRTSRHASQAFSALSWRDSLSLPGDAYFRADGELERRSGQAVVNADLAPAELAYAVTVLQPGDYRLRVRMSGPPGAAASAEIAPLAGGAALHVFPLLPQAAMGWVFAGSTHLDPGVYAAALLLPPGCVVGRVEVAPPCLNRIEPPGGWRTTAVTTGDELAVTLLQALDQEQELAPAATPIEIQEEDVRSSEAANRLGPTPRPSSSWALRAGPQGLHALVDIHVPEAGLYSISAFVSLGAGQRWLLDGCRKAVVCGGEGGGWRPILTQTLAAGRHTVALALGPGSEVERVRIEQKKHSTADYVAALERLGFDPGPAGAVSRARAIEAARFLRERRRSLALSLCGDPALVQPAPSTLVAVASERARASGQPAAPHVVPAVPDEPPLGPPILPPQAPATPTRPLGS